jgi:hypothetical protein
MRTREGLAVAKAKGRLRGKQPKLTARQEAHLVALHATGEHSPAELAELFSIGRSTVYRALDRARTTNITSTSRTTAGAGGAGDAAGAVGAADATVAMTSTGQGLLEELTWPPGYAPPCPACNRPTMGLREQHARVRGVRDPVVVARARPCGCPVDEHAAALQAAAPRGAQLLPALTSPNGDASPPGTAAASIPARGPQGRR